MKCSILSCFFFVIHSGVVCQATTATTLKLSRGLRGSLVNDNHTSSRYLAWLSDTVMDTFGLLGTGGATSYHSITDAKTLGATNYDAAVGNPLKGLLTSPRWVGTIPDNVPSTLEFYYIGLDEIMTGWNRFDWSVLDKTLRDAADRRKHVIWRIYCHYPGQKLRIPQFLLNAGIKLVSISDGGVSPQYDDPTLLRAFEQFIAAFGKRYDGHRSLAFIQLGLLGKWGEWHTYPDSGLLSSSTEDQVVSWYANAFQKTQMQIRTPRRSAFTSGVGLHDDSFAYSTLDGEQNGGQQVGWFFWPKVAAAGETSFWKKGVMGGETRPEIQSSVFKPDYAAKTPFKQDLMACVKTTHASYLLHNSAFQNGGYNGVELENALHAHARMGYNFRVNEVRASLSVSKELTVGIQVEQIGVAPFYYPLDLVLTCEGYSASAKGVEQLIEEGESNWFYFGNVPSSAICLQNLEVSFASDFVYADRPMKFAQGTDGRVRFSLPQPAEGNDIDSSTVSPTAAPAAVTTATPTATPTNVPTPFPTEAPTKSPIATVSPTFEPTPSPTENPSAAPVKAAAPLSFWEILLVWLRNLN